MGATSLNQRETMISKMHDMLLPVFSLFMFRLDAPRIHIGVIKSWAVASIPGFFVCMCCAAMKHCLANNVLGISSRIQHVFPPEDASSMLFIADTAISGICVALALCIAVPRASKNHFFNYAFLRYCNYHHTELVSIHTGWGAACSTIRCLWRD